MGRKPKLTRPAFGEHLLALRLRANLTLREVQTISGIPFATLSKWELTGELQNRVAILRLAKTYGISASVLLADIPAQVETMAEIYQKVARSYSKKAKPSQPLAKTATPQADVDAQKKTSSGDEV